MKRHSTAIALTLTLAVMGQARADFVESVVSGHYDSNGSFIGTPTTSSPTTENYSAGFIIDAIKPDTDPFKVFVRRNYFVFDLSSITEPVIAPTLVLPLGGYISPFASHTYLVTSSAFSAAELDDPSLVDPVSGQADIFVTMGVPDAPGQELVGDIDIIEADIPGLGPSPEISIALDEDFFNSKIGGELVLTARMFSDDGPTDIGLPGPDDDERILFAFTNPNEDFVDTPLGGATARPRIEFVPEPTSMVLLALGGVMLLNRRRR